MVTATNGPVFINLTGEPQLSTEAGGSRITGLDVAALRAALMPSQTEAEPLSLTLNLFDDIVLTLRTALIESFGSDGLTWRGQLPGVANVRGYLSVTGLRKDNYSPVTASGHVVINGQDYAIFPAGPGRVKIVITQVMKAWCGDILFTDQDDTTTYYDAAGDPQIAGGTAVIHILALYPTSTKQNFAAGAAGAAAIEAMMATAQTMTNEAFLHSGIDARVEIAVEECPVLRATDTQALLYEVINHKEGEAWKAVTAAREKAQASIVALLAREGTFFQGGFILGQAATIPEPPRFDASGLDYATFALALLAHTPDADQQAGYTFAHELGHLLGGKHDRLTQPMRGGFSPQYDYVRGFVPPDQSFVTIMGYEDFGRPYVPAYSAADKSWNGKVLGIPLGMPGAADAAHFFRLSTRVAACYRGDGAPRWVPAELALTVNPPLAGAIIPSALGPYPQDSVVLATATPRVGYKFVSWALDGQPSGSQPALSVTMDKAHALTAHFTDGDAQPRLSVKDVPAGSGLQIKLSPPGPLYPSGSEVYIELTGASDVYSLEQWLVDEQPAGDRAFRLRMEQDHQLGVRLKDSRIIKQQTAENIAEARARYELTVRVSGTNAVFLDDQWVVFTLEESTSAGAKLDGVTRVQTNSIGSASVTLVTGTTAGTVKVSATLENSLLSPVVFEVTVARRFIIPLSDTEAHIFDGDPAWPFVVLVRELGQPVAAGVKVLFSLEDAPAGVTLTPSEAETDDSGQARALFTRAASSTGRFTINVNTEGALFPAHFEGACVSRREIFCSAHQNQKITVGEGLFPFTVWVLDDDRHYAKNLPVHFALTAGTTGIVLESDSAKTNENGMATIHAHAPVNVGHASIIARAAHVTSPPERATFNIQVISGKGALQIVSGDMQSLPVGVVPKALVVQVLDDGKPVTAGVKVTFSIQQGAPGLSLALTEAETDLNGQATVTFTGAAQGAGTMAVSADTENVFSPVMFHVRVFKKREISWYSGRRQTIEAGQEPEDFVARVLDDDRVAPGVTVSFSMNSGTTGLKLHSESDQTDNNGHAGVTAGMATGAGEAVVTCSAEYATPQDGDPEWATFRVHVNAKP